MQYINFNFQYKGAFQNLKVRQALYHAIDVAALQKSNGSSGPPSSQIVPQDIFGYDPNITRLDYNPTEAKSLLKAAGYAKGVTIKMAFFDEKKALVSELKRQLAAVGITLVPQQYSGADGFDAALAPTTQSTYLSYGSDLIDLSDVAGFLFQPSDGYDFYNNSKVNQALKAANQTLDSTKRLALLQQVSDTIMKDVGMVPLWDLHIATVSDKPYAIQSEAAGAYAIYYWKVHL